MKMFVDTKETEFTFGNVREVRGNFIEHETEDGMQYECDYYRTYGNESFDELHKKEMAKQAQAYLNATDWVIAQLGEYQMLGKTLPDRSEILKKREEARHAIREVEE